MANILKLNCQQEGGGQKIPKLCRCSLWTASCGGWWIDRVMLENGQKRLCPMAIANAFSKTNFVWNFRHYI